MIEKDFGDWLSPMLVKEIRKGFRSRVFVLAFLLIQGLMIFCVILGSIAGDSNDNSSVFFWIIICIPLLLIMPSLGFGVLGNEIKGNTMELLFLTRLSAWRIVAGKWTAIVAQTLLIVCSVLPYIVLRYFIGGVNLLEDLENLGWFLFASALLTGMTIALSPFYRSMLAKLFLPIVTLIVVIVIMVRLSNAGPFLASPGNPFLHAFLISAVLGPLFLLLMFEIAVARIAPPAENHSFRKRLLGFLILGASALLNLAIHSPGLLMSLTVMLLLPVCITALCEDVKPIPSIYLPFVKRGFIGRLAGVVFYPGWPGGLVYTILAYAAFLAIFMHTRQAYTQDAGLQMISLGGGLLMPLAFEKLFFARLRKPLVIYLSVQIFMIIAMVLAAALKSNSATDWTELVAPLPTSVFFLAGFDAIDKSDQPLFIFAGLVVLAGSLLILLIKCIGPRREITELENIARDTLMKPVPAEIAHASAA